MRAEDGEAREEREGSSLGERLYDLFQEHRKRLAFVVLIVFLAAVALEIGGALPREVRLSYHFPRHGLVREARLEYTSDDELVRDVHLRWPDGAPREVRDRMDLSPGDYDISVLLIDVGGGARHLQGRLTAPADGVVRVMLRE